MLEAGEDARFIARRLVILASEDVGMADPMSLLVANAAAHAVEYVGLPEAQLNLAQAVVHLATAPKSNSATVGIGRARADVRAGVTGEVPAHLRDAHYQGAASLGHGDGYEYPHDDPRGWLPQQYLPDAVVGRQYYEPSAHGYESEVSQRMQRRNRRTRVTPVIVRRAHRLGPGRRRRGRGQPGRGRRADVGALVAGANPACDPRRAGCRAHPHRAAPGGAR